MITFIGIILIIYAITRFTKSRDIVLREGVPTIPRMIYNRITRK